MADSPAAGWYPDPEQPGQQRYWDGQQWTEHRAPLEGGTGPSQPAWSDQQQGWSGQQQGWSGQPVHGAVAGNVDTWLWQSIVATVLCCLPAGVVGIVFAAQANSAKNVGDVATAREKARIARIWTLVSVGFGVVVILLFFVFGIFGAITSSTTTFG